MTRTIADLADQLVAAHDGGPLVQTIPDHLVPADLDEVYALQDLVIARTGPVGGWKVAAGIGDPPLCSPIPANRFFAGGDVVDGKRHRIFLAEIEVAVRLGADLEAGATAQDVEAAVAGIHPAIELIGNPFTDRDTTPRNVQLGDLQSNGAVIVGPAMDHALVAALETLPVRLDYDGQPAHAVDKGASWQTIVGALAWLASHAASRDMPLKAGQVIITGSRALAPLNGAKMVDGVLGDFGRVSCGV